MACTYRGRAWKGEAIPYFEIWPDYRDKRPKGEQLFPEQAELIALCGLIAEAYRRT